MPTQEAINLCKETIAATGVEYPIEAFDGTWIHWMACAALAGRLTGVSPLYFIQRRDSPSQIGRITAENIGEVAQSWAWHVRPGEWDCDGFWCSERETEEFQEEMYHLSANILVGDISCQP